MSVAVSTLARQLEKLDAASPGTGTTQEYFINMGPQHPSTHGVLRLVLRLDGETVKQVVPVLGYIHRGIEKMGEKLGYRQFIHLSDRIDYLSAMMNNWAVSLAVERAAGIEISPRAQVIRTLMAELQRIQSHQLWWGVFGMDCGAITPFLYGFRDRELITDIFEETAGARLTMNYIQPGGVMFDLHPDFVAKTKAFIQYFRPKLDEYDTLLSGNVIFQERLRNVGVMSGADAVSFGTTGPILRASGVSLDLRRDEPYGAYGQAKFEVPVGRTGDSWDRYWVRVEEMRQSLNIIEQLIDQIPDGKHMVLKSAVKIKLPEGTHYSQVETARGILGVLIVSDGKDSKPYRIHLRTPCFNNLWAITAIAPGWRLADLVAILSSFDIVVPDIDR